MAQAGVRAHGDLPLQYIYIINKSIIVVDQERVHGAGGREHVRWRARDRRAPALHEHSHDGRIRREVCTVVYRSRITVDYGSRRVL